MFHVWNGDRVKRRQNGAKMEFMERINPSVVALLSGATAPQFSRKKASSCVPRCVQKRKLNFLRRRGAIKKSHVSMTSASAKKLKICPNSQLAEDYKYKLITHENHHLSAQEHKRKRKEPGRRFKAKDPPCGGSCNPVSFFSH